MAMHCLQIGKGHSRQARLIAVCNFSVEVHLLWHLPACREADWGLGSHCRGAQSTSLACNHWQIDHSA